MAIHHQPVMFCLTCYVQGIYRTKASCYQRVSPRCVCVCGGGDFSTAPGGGFTYKGSNIFWDIRRNYATKSIVAECVKLLCLGRINELLAAFLEFPGIDGEAGQWGRGWGGGAIESTHTRYFAYKWLK